MLDGPAMLAGIREAGVDRTRRAPAGDVRRPVGKGRHPAALNVGDRLTYAVAKLAGEPLLRTGNDVAGTDLTLAA